MSKIINTKSLITLALILTPLLTFAEIGEYVPLVGLPGFSDGSNSDSFNEFIEQLYIMAITIGAMLAVIKIIVAGVRWMMTDIVTNKSDAKKDIKGALIGLLIIISAALILETINPQLTNIDLTFSDRSTGTVSGGGGGGSNNRNEGDALGNRPPNRVSVGDDGSCPGGYVPIVNSGGSVDSCVLDTGDIPGASSGCLITDSFSDCLLHSDDIIGRRETDPRECRPDVHYWHEDFGCVVKGSQVDCALKGLEHEPGVVCE